MKQSKRGFGLAEVIVSFVLMVILIGVMATAIQFSQKLLQQADALREKTDVVARAFAQDQDIILSDVEITLTFTNGSLIFIIPVSIQERQIILSVTESESETLTFRVFAEP